MIFFDLLVTVVVSAATTLVVWTALTTSRSPVINRLVNRRATDRLCARAVRIHRILDDNELYDNNNLVDITLHHGRLGQLAAIRMAICLLNGWDLDNDADEEGPADELITAWWEKHYPDEWREPTGPQE